MEARGTVGAYTIGLNYTVRDHTELVAAHYFYASQLKDIPLKGSVQGELVELQGTDGKRIPSSLCRERKQRKQRNRAADVLQPLTFYNSVGLTGKWMLGTRALPVNLRLEHSTENPGQRMYANVTSQPDAAFEAMVQAVQKSILGGDRITTAKHMSANSQLSSRAHHHS
jgi:hypothetical protein